MDISIGNSRPIAALSTTALHHFALDGVAIMSLESLLQALKFEKASQQASVCADKPKAAKERARKLISWGATRKIWWQGHAIDRISAEHTQFMGRVLREMADQCPAFRQALLATDDEEFACAGKSRESEVTLTEAEYCSALTRLRRELNKHRVRCDGAQPVPSATEARVVEAVSASS